MFSPRRLHAEAWVSLLQGEAYLKVVGQVNDPAAVSGKFDPSKPAALLADLAEPQPLEVERLSGEAPGVGLLILLESTEADTIASLIAAGASGFVGRNEEFTNLVKALIAVGRGELALPPESAVEVLRLLARGEAAAPPDHEPLTEREREVLVQLAQGKTNKDIAQSLMISVRTVEAHLRSIYGKLEVNSRTEAALWAVHHDFDLQSETT